jgi:Rrf2 family protein
MAVQALVVLAETDGACSSHVIAHELKAHATFLRRVMALLVHAHILIAREGRDGGYCLARPADQITLAEVYQAAQAICQPEDTTIKAITQANVQCCLDQVASEVEHAILAVLDRYTIASIVKNTPRSHS